MEHYINIAKELFVNDQMTYDVAIVGYGPSASPRQTCSARWGSMSWWSSATPISTPGHGPSPPRGGLRTWQQVGLADRLNSDMLPGRAANFVDAKGVPFVKLLPAPRGNGHPPQQFIYQPALEKVLRSGVDRFPNVSLLLQHECLRVLQMSTMSS